MWQIARFKETELAQLRIVEREQCRQEVDKARREVCMFEGMVKLTVVLYSVRTLVQKLTVVSRQPTDR